MPFSIDGELSVGDNAQLTCQVSRGDMPINITWAFQSAEPSWLSKSLPEPISLNRIGKKIVMLEIPTVTEYHRGSYTCIASNRAGVVEYTTSLMVNGKKLFDTTFVELTLYICMSDNQALSVIINPLK